jgi:hypothetical protein
MQKDDEDAQITVADLPAIIEAAFRAHPDCPEVQLYTSKFEPGKIFFVCFNEADNRL